MGVTWSSEIISYIVGSDKKWSKIFYVSDLCNAMQGFLIFMLFVLKKKVKHLISNRYVSAGRHLLALLVLSPHSRSVNLLTVCVCKSSTPMHLFL